MLQIGNGKVARIMTATPAQLAEDRASYEAAKSPEKKAREIIEANTPPHLRELEKLLYLVHYQLGNPIERTSLYWLERAITEAERLWSQLDRENRDEKAHAAAVIRDGVLLRRAYALFILGGGIGWYLVFAAFEAVPHIGNRWMEWAASIVALVAGLWGMSKVMVHAELFTKRWIKLRHHRLPSGTLLRRQERAVKWVMVPFFIWGTPLLLSLLGSLSSQFE